MFVADTMINLLKHTYCSLYCINVLHILRDSAFYDTLCIK